MLFFYSGNHPNVKSQFVICRKRPFLSVPQASRGRAIRHDQDGPGVSDLVNREPPPKRLVVGIMSEESQRHMYC